jgi:hypothetical protein
MRYKAFEIRNYRAISGPLSVDVGRRNLFPIIGINESGKTTVLQAIFSFDHFNDDLNDGRHLKDTANLYKTTPATPSVSAAIELTRQELRDSLKELEERHPATKSWATASRRKPELPEELTITRDLKTLKYSINERPFRGTAHEDAFAQELILGLPYILYFDDFRDKVEEQIPIPRDASEISGWAATLEQLFKQTEESLSILQLPDMEGRQRKSVLAKVQRNLNKTLTKEWQNFRLDDREALEIGIEYDEAKRHIKLEIVERDSQGDHYFFISDRSKGFYWFFNFVMKLEFNPKVAGPGEQGTIYLLDEPGSYLHATAQAKLCSKLRALSERNAVIYCTHSHYLLNPEVIPLSSIVVADKDASGSISLVSIHEHKGSIRERRSAFQPVVDALQIKPFLLDMTGNRAAIVEGIYDYYALELFRRDRPVSVLPSVGADSMKFYISLLIAWQVRFRALWDNDAAGRRSWDEARELFGEDLAERSFRLLPADPGKNKKLQDLFDGADLVMLRKELGLAKHASFEKTVATLFFASQKNELVNSIGAQTHQNFAALWERVTEGL